MNENLYISEIGKLIEELQRYIKLHNGQQLPQDSYLMMKEFINSEYEVMLTIRNGLKTSRGSEAEIRADAVMQEVSKVAQAIGNDSINCQALTASCDQLKKYAAVYEAGQEKGKLLTEIFQSDATEMQLHDKKIKMMQELVNLDIKIYGKVSSDTLEVLEVQHCEIIDNKVQEKEEKTIEQNTLVQNGNYQEGEIINLKLPKMEPEEKKALENKLLAAGARYHKGTIPADKSSTGQEVNYKSWYIKYKEGMDISVFQTYIKDKAPTKTKSIESTPERNEADAGKAQDTVNVPDTAKTPEPRIYLHLPHAGREKFQQIIQDLKTAGAKFDALNKAWYVTAENDLNKFAKYLITPTEVVKSITKSEKRDSVKEKLKSNQKEISDAPKEQKAPQQAISR